MLSKRTKELLDDIENRIDSQIEEDFISQWRDFTFGNFSGDIFTPKRKAFSNPGVQTVPVNINDALEDMDLMLYSQLCGVSYALDTRASARESSLNLSIRANYGSAILSSMFGAEIFVMPRNTNTLPTTKPFNDFDAMQRLIDAGVPDVRNGFGRKVFEFAEFVNDVFSKYPKISKYVIVYHPDLQGTLDTCEQLFSNELFYAMADDPDSVHSMLKLINKTYIAALDKWMKYIPSKEDFNPHWGNLWHRGKIMLRADSAMNISPDYYKEFSAPYDAELLEYYGGGAIHFCGRGDHYIEILSKTPKVYAINMSQPHLNDMETIYKNTVDKGLKILGFDSVRAKKDVGRGFNHNLSI